MSLCKTITSACLILAASGSAHAESMWGLGIGAVVQDQGYKDASTEVQPFPVIFYQSERLQVLGPRASYTLWDGGALKFSAVGQFRLNGFKEDDEDIFAGMDERSSAFDLGLEASYAADWGQISLAYLSDVTNEYEGNEISLSYSKGFQLDAWRVEPFVTISRASEELVDYYYGVRAHEVTTTRAFYEGEASTNVELGVNTNWRVGQHHNFIINASYTAYGSEIKDSPLVDGSGNASLILGYMYVF